VEAVADLVAFLVASTRDLHILTTSRAPLAVAAERVYPLGELGARDAAELFRQRAVAARPDVVLDERAIAEVVARLDGLPLAIELAAVKVRVMSVADIARRLEDRFTLLRGGVRGAPDRHQTLQAVIEWSQNLLAERERRAWRWLSVFHDGCTLAAAEEMLGPGAADAVQSLVDQSLLAVRESGAGVRFRMLETVREFGRRQLARSGEEADALAAQRRWATRYADAAWSGLHGPDQVRCMDLMHEEETNLADVLRQALTTPDPPTVVVLFAALGAFWSISDDHPRVIALADAIRSALRGWEPPPELADHTRMAVAFVLFEDALMVDEKASGVEELWALLRRLAPGSAHPAIAASVAVVLAADPADPDGTTGRLDELCESPDPWTATNARMWCGHARENAGDPEGAIALITRALAVVPGDAGPWIRAVLHAQLAHLHASLGRHDDAVEHAERAIPVLDRLGAVDDTVQLRAITAVHALVRGRFDDAERIFTVITTSSTRRPGFGGPVTVLAGRAELALARGRTADGLRLYRETVTRVRELRFPGLSEMSGREPWTIFGESACLAAHALHGAGKDGADIEEALRRKAIAYVQPAQWRIDHPVMGLALYSLGLWALRRGTLPPPAAVRLVALAERFAYNRLVPTMDWAHAVDAAERVTPGLLAEILAAYGERRGPELIDEARGVLRRAVG
jgi:predicted ATPase